MNSAYRIVVKVTTLSGRVLPERAIFVRADSREEAESIACGVCQILERAPVQRPSFAVSEGAAAADEDLTLEQAVVLAVTGKWEVQ